MSNGDRWKVSDGREGIEVGRNGEFLKVAIIAGRMLAEPQWFPMGECELMPSRYLKGELPEQE